MGTSVEIQAELFKLAWPIAGAVIALLLGINGWFVSRLVTEMSATHKKVNALPDFKLKIDAMSVQMDNLKHQVGLLAAGQTDLGHLRERVAVLEEALRARGRSPRNAN